MADSLASLGCTVSDHNLVLNVLWGLNKQYDHLHAIITCGMPFLSFHKVRDELVLEELTPTPQAFYSNKPSALPPPALSHPPGNDDQGQGQGRDRSRYHKNGDGRSAGGGGSNAFGQGNKGQGSKPCPAFLAFLLQPLDWCHQHVPWSGSGGGGEL
jgi:hypothetical protein